MWQVLSFPTNCSSCNVPAETRMKLVGILSLLLLLCNVPSRLGNRMNSKRKYFLLTKFELPIVSYRPCFSSTIYGLSMKIAGHELKGKSRIIIYSMDREDEYRKIYYYTCILYMYLYRLLCAWLVWDWFLFAWNSFKFLIHMGSKTSDIEIVRHSLACLKVQFKLKDSL